MGSSKEACLKALNDTFDTLISTYESMDEESLKKSFTIPFDPKQPKCFQFISEFITHHRGQALVSLRMQGIKAPPYRLY